MLGRKKTPILTLTVYLDINVLQHEPPQWLSAKVPKLGVDATREKAVCAALETAGLHGVLTSHLSSPTVVTERHLWHLALCRTETLQLGSGVTPSLHVVTDFGTAQISLSTEGLTVSVLHIVLGFVLRPIAGLLRW